MRRNFLPAVLAITLTSGLALAQAPAPNTTPQVRRHAHNPHREAMKISQKLNLSADQTAKLEPILANLDQKVTSLRSNTALSPQDVKVQMRAIHKETKQQLNAVLTPEQMQQFKDDAPWPWGSAAGSDSCDHALSLVCDDTKQKALEFWRGPSFERVDERCIRARALSRRWRGGRCHRIWPGGGLLPSCPRWP